MTTKRAVPDYGLSIIDDEGCQTPEFNDVIDDLVHGLPLTGEGSPEGVVEARQGQFYIDTINTPALYVKQLAAIGGDKTMGWDQ